MLKNEKLNILSKSRYNVDLILVIYYKAKPAFFRYNESLHLQIKPLIQRTPTGKLSTVACFETREFELTTEWEALRPQMAWKMSFSLSKRGFHTRTKKAV